MRRSRKWVLTLIFIFGTVLVGCGDTQEPENVPGEDVRDDDRGLEEDLNEIEDDFDDVDRDRNDVQENEWGSDGDENNNRDEIEER